MPARWQSASATSVEPSADARDLKWDPLLVCVAGYILTAVGRIHQLFPVLELLRPAIVTGALAIGRCLFDRLGRREQRRFDYSLVRTTKYLLVLLVWAVFSVPGSLWEGHSFDMVFGSFLKTVLMCLVIAGAVRGIRDVERLAVVYLLAAATYAGVVVSQSHVGSVDDWRLSTLYYYDANDFATFAVTAMPFGLYLLHAARRTLSRVLAFVSLVVLTMAFVRSGSRGGLIALAAVVCCIVLGYTAIALRRRLLATALVAIVVLGTASDQYWNHISTTLSDSDYNVTSESGRLQVWRRGIGYMLEHPIFGVGPDNFPVAEGTLSPLAERQSFGIGVKWSTAHNSFIQVGAELGIPGLVFFVGMIVSALAALQQSARPELAGADADASGTGLTQALTASLIGFLVGSVFLSLAYSEILYTLIALAVGMYKVAARPGTTRERSVRTPA